MLTWPLVLIVLFNIYVEKVITIRKEVKIDELPESEFARQIEGILFSIKIFLLYFYFCFFCRKKATTIVLLR